MQIKTNLLGKYLFCYRKTSRSLLFYQIDNKYVVSLPKNSIGELSAIYTRRVARQYGICRFKKELSLVHFIFFWNKTFLVVKIERVSRNLTKFELIQTL